MLFVDDRIDDKWVSARVRNAVWVVGAIEGDGGPRSPEESGRGRLGSVYLTTRELLLALGVTVGPPKVMRQPISSAKASSSSVSSSGGLGFLFLSPFLEPLDRNFFMSPQSL
jgi:hypothetical protein